MNENAIKSIESRINKELLKNNLYEKYILCNLKTYKEYAKLIKKYGGSMDGGRYTFLVYFSSMDCSHYEKCLPNCNYKHKRCYINNKKKYENIIKKSWYEEFGYEYIPFSSY